mmetsp:Transcript_15729/g.26531  ORF Transcript_15729/g.26531 Transcript_15729/m.26531 type:complete len:361 (+) Transcript_15729:161-1243(+)|eukprot:CAMPEP_0198210420 /NCGR_PEP_ID=MMETSP1445-20131203/20096_1 /TAXON_ID=36898 /ORGANISM="Pyramimonas sp., Strain CCMP2087" /LENGTH=360 /DNA_ID=CAMNT_0043884481 /DNA_START=147 /DNA_END=1229 /DNA_ORIENTATION=-
MGAFASKGGANDSYVESVMDCVGNTPLIKLQRSTAPGATVLCKLEAQNPGGSVKDRIAKRMIEGAEKNNLIIPGKTTIIEATSGNTGIGVAMAAAAKGYKCVIVMPQLPPMYERYIICRKFGAEVHLTAGAKGVPGMLVYLKDMLEKHPNMWCPSQFDNDDNPAAHMETTGPEIWNQCKGKVDYFVAGIGTGGTINGVGSYLKKKNPDLKIIAVEPTESRVLIGQAHGKHTVLGIGAGMLVKFVEKLSPGQEFKAGPRGIIDEFLHANTDESCTWANNLAKNEGLLVGPSSGCAAKVAADIAARPEAQGKTIVVIFPSSGIRYVNHPVLWTAVKDEAKKALPAPPNMDAEPLLRWESDRQ